MTELASAPGERASDSNGAAITPINHWIDGSPGAGYLGPHGEGVQSGDGPAERGGGSRVGGGGRQGGAVREGGVRRRGAGCRSRSARS